nr:zinc finger, CCHC-type, retrotransposon Gag domain protein [Tanacetum cinerariifolium]
MVNTRTDTDLSAAVQNALQALLPQIREEIREEFRTGSGSSNADAFKTRLAVYKFEGNALAWWKAYKQAKGGDAWLVTVTWADFKKLFFLQFFPRAEQERLKREYHSIRQTSTETSTEFMQRFLRLAGFLEATAGTEEEQAKNFQWGLRRRGGNDNHRGSNNNNNYSSSNNRNSGNGRDQRNRGHQSNRSANS